MTEATTTEPRVVEGLSELVRPLDGLRPDPRNPRRHPREQLEAIAASLMEHGQDQPLVARAEDGTLVKGEGRWRAMRELLGWEEAAVLLVDEDDRSALRRALADHGSRRASYLNEATLERLLARVTEDGDRPVAGFGSEFLESLRMALDTAPRSDAPDDGWGGAAAEDWQDRAKDVAEEYLNSVVKQVVLIYEPDEYEVVVDALSDVMEETGAETHTEAALWLLEWWEGRQQGGGEGDDDE